MASRAEEERHAGGWIPGEPAWRGLDKGRGCICPHGLAQASPAFLPALGPSRLLDPSGGVPWGEGQGEGEFWGSEARRPREDPADGRGAATKAL